MIVINDLLDERVISCLNDGGIVVACTDTLYGVLARADNEAAVSRVYELKQRSPEKSPIVLISDWSQLHDKPSARVRQLMDQSWPGPVSIIMPTKHAPVWLRRQNCSVAYRMPDRMDFQQLIQQTGPLIAPSANPETQTPAMTVEQAVAYFGDRVDIYVDGGQVESIEPSTLLRIDQDGSVERLR